MTPNRHNHVRVFKFAGIRKSSAMPGIKAIIDMGTNTFHLVIASFEQDGYKILHRESQGVKIGKGSINKRVIGEDGVARAVQTLKSFQKTIQQFQAGQTYAFGTSAIRSASNREEVIRRIAKETGIQTHLISGHQEAELIYYGVKAALDLGTEKSLIVDIGGGSVEFIIADSLNIFWKESFDMGGQRLLEKFQKHDPIAPEEIQSLNDYFGDILRPLFTELQRYQPATMVGSSGTYDTLSDIFMARQGIHFEAYPPELPLTIEAFSKIFEELLHKNRSERMQIPGMIEMRVDMIVVACCLIRFLLDRHPFKKIRVSSWSMKEGVLYCLQHGLL